MRKTTLNLLMWNKVCIKWPKVCINWAIIRNEFKLHVVISIQSLEKYKTTSIKIDVDGYSIKRLC